MASKDLAEPPRYRVVELHEHLELCAHGHEIRGVSTEESIDGWVVWGHYPCAQCSQVALDLFRHRPTIAVVGARRLPVEPAR